MKENGTSPLKETDVVVSEQCTTDYILRVNIYYYTNI